MDTLIVATCLGIVGLLFGSFAGAQVWRLRAQQLIEDQRDGEEVNQKELHKLKSLARPVTKDRSECLRCHHVLEWYDLIPIVSWVSLRGKCRYCHRFIGWYEPLVEIGTAAVFVLSYLAWPHTLDSVGSVALLGLWLIACVLMVILFVYDMKWSLLPFAINIAVIVVAAAFALLSFSLYGVDWGAIQSLIGAIGILAVLYFLFSLAGWVGLGDSILGVGMALLLGTWELAFLALFLANLLGCVAIIPQLRGKRSVRGMRIPFGPLLITATIISMLWGAHIIESVFTTTNLLLNTLMV